MIINASDLNEHTCRDTSVCILGSGAAGITLACELIDANFKVILVEAGGRRASGSNQDFYRGDARPPHPPADEFRRVLFGGTTRVWGGRCVPLDEVDFESRDHVPNSGWPIPYREIAAYYPQALQYCDAGAFDFIASSAIAGAAETIGGLDAGRTLEMDLIERYSLPTDFGRRYAPRIRRAGNVTAILNARCTGLLKAAGEDRLRAAQLVTPNGSRHEIAASVFVLALGGIESTRMLLASGRATGGLGNRYDRLGRFYACHIEATVGRLVPNGAPIAFDFERTRDGAYCRRKIRFSADAQRRHQLLNTAFRLHFPSYSDASHESAVLSTIYLAKSTILPEYRKILQQDADYCVISPNSAHRRNIRRDVPALAKFAFDWVFRRKLARRKLPYTLIGNADGSYPLEFNCEQTPLESSRITLLDEIDANGVPRVKIDWRCAEDDLVAVERAFGLLRETLSASGLCRLEFDPDLLRRRLATSAPVGGHHIGSARMAASERAGVVDTNLAVFGIPNLYVASSATFPTGGHANPTLSIVALAIRLGRHLRTRHGTAQHASADHSDIVSSSQSTLP